MAQEDKYYHSRLLALSYVFDRPIEQLKNSYIDEKYSNWIIWLLLSPIRDIPKIKSVSTGVKGLFNLSMIPILSAATMPIYLNIPGIHTSLDIVIGYLLGYLFTLFFYYRKILQFDSGHFHTGAYRKFRNQEYQLFRAAFLDDKNDFYFKGLYDYLDAILQRGENFDSLITTVDTRLDNYLQNERVDYKKQVAILEDKLNQTEQSVRELTDDYDAMIDELIKDRDQLMEGAVYVIQLIKDINILLYRIKNKLFSTKDLNLVSGFTLYEKDGEVMRRIEDVGTTGISPIEIPLDSQKYSEWGVLKVINEDLKTPFVNDPYSNHSIVSYQMKMDYGRRWVFNFHFDKSDLKSYHLLINDDIIESREVYRLIHALCLLSQDNQLFPKEAANK